MNKEINERTRKPELLAPAGSLEKLEYAVAYGADAVYLSGRQYGLRQAAGNFTLPEIGQGVRFAHENGKKVYAAVNIYARDGDVPEITRYLQALNELGVDALIVADPGILHLARQYAPLLPVHLSTQANTLNSRSVVFWADAGVSRVSLARELALSDIEEITAASKVEVEVFIHGAMCIAYSGRCLLSKYLAGREANRGNCAQACRWRYAVVEEKRPGEFYPLEEDETGTYLFNSKDLCLIDYLPRLIKAGVHSVKIEGRTKSLHYLATVTRVYRQAIDTYMVEPSNYGCSLNKWREELEKVSHRAYSPGFVGSTDDREQTNTGSPSSTHDFVGVVSAEVENNLFKVKIKNRLRVGEEVEILQPKKEPARTEIKIMVDCGTDLEVRETHANCEVFIPLEEKIEKNSILRRKTAE